MTRATRMEMSHQGGAEGESLLRSDQRAVVMPYKPSAPAWESGEGERAPFLRQEPVKLTPAWEGSNLPNDTLNLKGIAMDLAPPKDRYHLIYWTMILHGLGTLTAWNMFITAQDYFVNYKLHKSVYAENFLVYVGFASQIPNFLFSWLNVFVTLGGDLTFRIVCSLIAEVIIFVITVIMAMLDTSSTPGVFFWITMVCIFLLNGFNAIFQNSVYGVAARLPTKYTGCVILGSNIAGCLVVFISWLADYIGGNVRTAAIYYFITGIFVLLLCFDTYFALPVNRFYRYYMTLDQRVLQTNPALAANQQPQKTRTPYGAILRIIWVQIYNVFITFFVTLVVFPALHVEAKPYNTQDLFSDKNFMLLTCFLTFNVTATFGNFTASIWRFPSRRWLFVFTTLRLAFIPLYLLSNLQPHSDVPRTLPVLITNDWVYWAIAVLFGWSHGQASALSMMYVSGNVPPEHAAKAGMLGGATLITGILTGIAVSGVCIKILFLDVWKDI